MIEKKLWFIAIFFYALISDIANFFVGVEIHNGVMHVSRSIYGFSQMNVFESAFSDIVGVFIVYGLSAYFFVALGRKVDRSKRNIFLIWTIGFWLLHCALDATHIEKHLYGVFYMPYEFFKIAIIILVFSFFTRKILAT